MPWVKGKSGNPNGRRKTAHAITVIARRHCRTALSVAVELLSHADAMVRLKAATMLLDRGIGRPAQCVTAAQLTDEELRDELIRRRDASVEPPTDRPGPEGPN